MPVASSTNKTLSEGIRLFLFSQFHTCCCFTVLPDMSVISFAR
ncbi:hypothetical protein CSC14_2756 [Proteus mirabilis]|nr:hypothetical protein CSC14_2756 [Proteus mirabilis]